MIRRDFISTAAISTLFGYFGFGRKKKSFLMHHSALGKYLGIEGEMDVTHNYGTTMYPIEHSITLRYEKGTVTYLTFNMHREVLEFLLVDPEDFVRMATDASEDVEKKLLIDPVIYRDQKFRISNIKWNT